MNFEFNIFERIVLFGYHLILLAIVMTMVYSVTNAHGTPGAQAEWLAETGFYMLAGTVGVALFFWPLSEGLKTAYRRRVQE